MKVFEDIQENLNRILLLCCVIFIVFLAGIISLSCMQRDLYKCERDGFYQELEEANCIIRIYEEQEGCLPVTLKELKEKINE